MDNPQHERMAQELAKGADQSEAHRLAGFSGKRAAASNLMAKHEIGARVKELQDASADQVVLTVADIARQLAEDRALAHSEKQPGAAVSASMGLAKLLGMLSEKVKHVGGDDGDAPISFTGFDIKFL